MIRLTGQYCQERTARIELPGQNSQDGLLRTRQLGWDFQERTNKTARTDCQDGLTRRGHQGPDSGIARIGQPGLVCKERKDSQDINLKKWKKSKHAARRFFTGRNYFVFAVEIGI